MKKPFACFAVMGFVLSMMVAAHAADSPTTAQPTTNKATATKTQIKRKTASSTTNSFNHAATSNNPDSAPTPEMTRVLHDLKNAMSALQHDRYEYGGARVKAMTQINAIIQELNLAVSKAKATIAKAK